VTTAQKEPPPVDVVRARMAAIQQVIQEGGHAPCDINDTGIGFGAQPMNQYVPEGVRRGSAPACNTMARFTALRVDGQHGPALHHHPVRGRGTGPAQHAHPRHPDAVPRLHSR
jgi:hypothetical protein